MTTAIEFTPTNAQVLTLYNFWIDHVENVDDARVTAAAALRKLYATGADDRAKLASGMRIGGTLRQIRNSVGGIEWATDALDRMQAGEVVAYDVGSDVADKPAPRDPAREGREAARAEDTFRGCAGVIEPEPSAFALVTHYLKSKGYALAAIRQALDAAFVRVSRNLKPGSAKIDPDDLHCHALAVLHLPLDDYLRGWRTLDLESQRGSIAWGLVAENMKRSEQLPPFPATATVLDASSYNPDLLCADSIAELVRRTRLDKERLAKRLGITVRALRYYMSCQRPLPYLVYFGLQAIAAQVGELEKRR